MKFYLHASIILLSLASLVTVSAVAQRSAGGYSIGKDSVFEQHISNYPNSFSTATTIAYSLPHDGKISLKIYNASGQWVTTLFEGEQKAGSYTTEFNASHKSDGVYFCKFIVVCDEGEVVLTRKMICVK